MKGGIPLLLIACHSTAFYYDGKGAWFPTFKVGVITLYQHGENLCFPNTYTVKH